MQIIPFLVVIVLFKVLLKCESRKTPPQRLTSAEQQRFLDLATAAHDPNREVNALRALKQASGVYIDTAKSKLLELESTVVVVSLLSF